MWVNWWVEYVNKKQNTQKQELHIDCKITHRFETSSVKIYIEHMISFSKLLNFYLKIFSVLEISFHERIAYLLTGTFDLAIYLSLCTEYLSGSWCLFCFLDASKKKSFKLKWFSFTSCKGFSFSYIRVLHLTSSIPVKVSSYLGLSNAICRANVFHPVLSSAHSTLHNWWPQGSGVSVWPRGKGVCLHSAIFHSSAISDWSHVFTYSWFGGGGGGCF